MRLKHQSTIEYCKPTSGKAYNLGSHCGRGYACITSRYPGAPLQRTCVRWRFEHAKADVAIAVILTVVDSRPINQAYSTRCGGVISCVLERHGRLACQGSGSSMKPTRQNVWQPRKILPFEIVLTATTQSGLDYQLGSGARWTNAAT
jgi:hypothetical protein